MPIEGRSPDAFVAYNSAATRRGVSPDIFPLDVFAIAFLDTRTTSLLLYINCVFFYEDFGATPHRICLPAIFHSIIIYTRKSPTLNLAGCSLAALQAGPRLKWSCDHFFTSCPTQISFMVCEAVNPPISIHIFLCGHYGALALPSS